MCEPTTIMLGLTLLSTATAAKSSYDQGKYQEGVGKYNARVAENTSQDVRNAANEAENAQRQQTAQLLARQRARQAASNIDINSGSALQIQNDTMTLGEADALRIRSNADSQVSALRSGADLSLAGGAAARVAGNNAAVGSLLSGASSVMGSGVADKWLTPDSAASVAAADNKTWYDGSAQLNNSGAYA